MKRPFEGWGYQHSLARRIIEQAGPATPELGLSTLVKAGAMQVGGLLLVVVAVGACIASRGIIGAHPGGGPVRWFEVVASAGGILFFLSSMLFNTGWVQALPFAEAASPRTLLYLRPFEVDVRAVLPLAVGASAGLVIHFATHGYLCFLAVLLLAVRVGDEQRLQYAFGPFGRLLTFRHPGKKLLPVGAMRLAAEADWQRDVTRRMQDARLVIVRPGESESMRWEVMQALRTVPPERLVFYLRFPGSRSRKRRAYDTFRAQLQAFVPARLSERLPSGTWVAMDRQWRPRVFTPSNRPADLVRQALSGDFERERIRPLLAALGDEFRREPLTLRERIRNSAWDSPLVRVFVAIVFCAVLAVVTTVIFLALVLALRL
jgi:hypothetical protein